MYEVDRRRWIVCITALIGMVLLAACSEGFTPTPGSHTMPVDVLFKEFYYTLGGEPVLGPAISPLEIRDNLQCQFAERALMCFNPAATGTARFSLYPLGLELGVQGSGQISAISLTNARIIDGFPVYEKFLPLYDRLYGSRYVGRPLTELRINQELQRLEQFFENVGFYQSLNDSNGPVYLIPYGAYLCGGECSYRLEEYWSIVKSNVSEQPFAASVARLGGPAVFGELLLKPQTAEDGYIQQVYASAIFFAPAEDPSQVRLRPLPLMLGYPIQPLVEQVSHEQLVFYEVENGLGHNIPRPFDEYIALHGGRDLAGKPISEVGQVPGQNLFQQCFENFCLIFNPAAPDGMRVTLLDLGKRYLEQFPVPQEEEIHEVFTPDRIQLTVSADKPTINAQEEQVIRISTWQIDSNQPLSRVEGTLILNLPNQPSVRFYFSPTDENGMATVVIPSQSGLSNGVRLSYQACLNLPSEQPICAVDSYLIWNVQ